MQNLRIPVDSILLAVFTVSPKMQYLGILIPTTPATTGPVKDNIVHDCHLTSVFYIIPRLNFIFKITKRRLRLNL